VCETRDVCVLYSRFQGQWHLLSLFPQVPSLASLERMAMLVYQNFFTRNIEPKFSRPVSSAQSRQLSTIVCCKTGWLQPACSSQTLSPVQGSETRMLHWFSLTVSFSQPLVPAQAHRPPDDDKHPDTTVQFQSTTASAVPHVTAGEAWTTQPDGRTLFGLRRSPQLFDISGPLRNITTASLTFVFAYI
jgi:hypothetical protein